MPWENIKNGETSSLSPEHHRETSQESDWRYRPPRDEPPKPPRNGPIVDPPPGPGPTGPAGGPTVPEGGGELPLVPRTIANLLLSAMCGFMTAVLLRMFLHFGDLQALLFGTVFGLACFLVLMTKLPFLRSMSLVLALGALIYYVIASRPTLNPEPKYTDVAGKRIYTADDIQHFLGMPWNHGKYAKLYKNAVVTGDLDGAMITGLGPSLSFEGKLTNSTIVDSYGLVTAGDVSNSSIRANDINLTGTVKNTKQVIDGLYPQKRRNHPQPR
jgi:hypothetical protein